MAQRTGVDGFLTPLAKVASAGALPALAAAALLALAGCGGGSDSEANEAPTAASAAQGQPGPAPAADEGQGSPQSSSQAAKGSAGTSPEPGTGARQGRRVLIPKGEPERPPSASQSESSTLASIALASPAIRSPDPEAIGALPAAHTCDGADTWPALQWRGIPAGSAELLLFAMSTEPVGGEIFFNWALAGLDPSLGGIEAGRLPPGALVGQNSYGRRGYSICPRAGTRETYVFALYALPRPLSPKRGFDPAALRKEALALAGNVGFLPATYARGQGPR